MQAPSVLSLCLFNFGNNIGRPDMLGFAAKIDKSARLTVLGGALHTGGQAPELDLARFSCGRRANP